MTQRLGDILVQMRCLSPEQLAAALPRQQETRQMLGDVLVDMGFATREDVARALAVQIGVPFQELGADFTLRPEDVRLLPEAVVRRFCMFAIKSDDSPRLTLVMRDPLDLAAVDTVRTLTRLEVRKTVSSEDRIRDVIERHYGASANIRRSLQDIARVGFGADAGAIEAASVEAAANADQLAMQANDAPVVQFVNLLLQQAVNDRASDIHFEPDETEVRVRMRVDGVLRAHTPPPRSLYSAVVTRLKILANMDIAERRLPLDGRFKFKANDRMVDVRVSSLPEVHGEKVVLRLLNRDSLVVDMEAAGFEPVLRDRFQRILRAPHGIILLTGPTGSGKTTTLYSALSYLVSPEVNIQTVEDPVEYQLAGVNQMQIKPQIGLGFPDALRAILRQDPDIIMIGEVRDRDTADIAMRASLTGHLVLSTLHTNDAPAAITRLMDIGIAPYLIAATIRLVIAQRLVRRICDACRQDAPDEDEVRRLAAALVPEAAAWRFQSGAGCPRCNRTGFRGRTAVLEFLEMSDPLRALVTAGANETAIRQRAIELGLVPLLHNGLDKARRGITTAQEILDACISD
jgi:type IV pilus assembly protein PilB